MQPHALSVTGVRSRFNHINSGLTSCVRSVEHFNSVTLSAQLLHAVSLVHALSLFICHRHSLQEEPSRSGQPRHSKYTENWNVEWAGRLDHAKD